MQNKVLWRQNLIVNELSGFRGFIILFGVELGKVELRDVRDTIQYSVASGCVWSLLPKDFIAS